MKARDARAMGQRIRSLEAQTAYGEVVNLLDRTAGALEHSKLRNAYACALLELGQPQRAEELLLESVRKDAANLFALRLLMSFDKSRALPLSGGDESRYATDGVELVRHAAVLLRVDRAEEAFASARQAIRALSNAEQRSCARQGLASLMLWRGRLDLAERLVLSERAEDELHSIVWDLVALRRVAVHDEQTLTWFRFLVFSPNPWRTRASVAYFDYCWATYGANETLAELGERLQRQVPDDDVELRVQRIALAHELGQRDMAVELLRSHARCAEWYPNVLPIARLLCDEPRLGTLRSGVSDPEKLSARADLHRHLVDASRRLGEYLAEPARRIAIVGNSTCETGKGLGPTIDGHDVVVRFNAAPNHGAFCDDYGKRTDVHVLPTRGASRRPAAADARTVLFTNPDLVARNRDWAHAAKLVEQGKEVACVGTEDASLVRRLEAPPSNGLRVLSYINSLRGRLAPESLFGFSFVDQVGPNAASSHYYEKTWPSMHHKWAKELELLQEMLGT